MFRSLLTLLLLLNYLLVVGVGLLVSRPPTPRYTAAHPYVHSAECQRHNYLRLDCFERCNGEQPAAASRPPHSGPHLLALLKGLDEHCPVTLATRLPAARRARQSAASYSTSLRPAPRPGHAGRDPRPPQRA